jgi:transcriptional regulator with XRE-family HTH domain
MPLPHFDRFQSAEALKTLGFHLRTARMQRGLTQAELGSRCGVTQTELSNIEQGKRLPSLTLFFRFAQVLEFPLERFLSGQVRPPVDRRTVLIHLHWLGVVDLLTPTTCVQGAFPPPEETLAWILNGNTPDPRLVEAIPAVLAWNAWDARLLEAYGSSQDPRVLTRLAWLADVALTLHRSDVFGSEFKTPLALETFIHRVAPPSTPDDLGRPMLHDPLPPFSRRWNIHYAATFDTFAQRARHLKSLKAAEQLPRKSAPSTET